MIRIHDYVILFACVWLISGCQASRPPSSTTKEISRDERIGRVPMGTILYPSGAGSIKILPRETHVSLDRCKYDKMNLIAEFSVVVETSEFERVITPNTGLVIISDLINDYSHPRYFRVKSLATGQIFQLQAINDMVQIKALANCFKIVYPNPLILH